MVSRLLKVLQAALCRDGFEGRRHCIVKMYDAFLDRIVKDGRERCGRIIKLAA